MTTDDDQKWKRYPETERFEYSSSLVKRTTRVPVAALVTKLKK